MDKECNTDSVKILSVIDVTNFLQPSYLIQPTKAIINDLENISKYCATEHFHSLKMNN